MLPTRHALSTIVLVAPTATILPNLKKIRNKVRLCTLALKPHGLYVIGRLQHSPLLWAGQQARIRTAHYFLGSISCTAMLLMFDSSNKSELEARTELNVQRLLPVESDGGLADSATPALCHTTTAHFPCLPPRVEEPT